MQHATVPIHGVPRDAVRLSKREITILRLLCQGLIVKQIAFRLRLSPTYVSGMVFSIRRNLHLTSRLDLYRWSLQHPKAFRRRWVEIKLHSQGCTCRNPYCTSMARSWNQILAA